jgi:hypothetical protein
MTADKLTETRATTADRQRKLRQKRDAAGLVEVRNLWAHPDDVDAIRQHARDLASKRSAAKDAG